MSYGYYENGILKERVTIKDGFENGDFEEYYPSGAVHWRGQYIDGPNEQDTLYEYAEDGALLKKMMCHKGWCSTVQ